MLSQRKLHANRLNAQKSTGPRTPDGKARSSQNATSHGFFCRDAVLPGESQDEFDDLRERFIDDLRPQTQIELRFVDTIALANWKLRRLQTSELHMHDSKEDEIRSKHKAYIQRITEESRGRFRPDVTDKLIEISKEQMDGSVSIACALVTLDRSFERLAMLEMRLNNQISRAIRDLGKLRRDLKEIKGLPPSMFSKHRMNSLDERYETFCRETQSRTGYRPPPLRAIENTRNEPTARHTAPSDPALAFPAARDPGAQRPASTATAPSAKTPVSERSEDPDVLKSTARPQMSQSPNVPLRPAPTQNARNEPSVTRCTPSSSAPTGSFP